jgi:hypothetical protein
MEKNIKPTNKALNVSFDYSWVAVFWIYLFQSILGVSTANPLLTKFNNYFDSTKKRKNYSFIKVKFDIIQKRNVPGSWHRHLGRSTEKIKMEVS